MFTVNISFDASTRILKDDRPTPDYCIGTTGDNNSTKLVFTITDDDHVLDDMAGRVEFDVWVDGGEGKVYKPYIQLDQDNSVTLPSGILRAVRRGILPVQLAFGDDSGHEMYSLNTLMYKIAPAVSSAEVQTDVFPQVLEAYAEVSYDEDTQSLIFTRLNGDVTVLPVGDLFGSNLIYDVSAAKDTSSVSDPIVLTFYRNNDTTFDIGLPVPYLDNGKIPDKFLDHTMVVDLFKVQSVSNLTDGTCATARPPDFAIVGGVDLYMCIDNDPSQSSSWYRVNYPLVTEWQNQPDDTHIPTERLVKNSIDAVQNDIDAHEARKDNPHDVTKAQVGLGNVDNTSDADKPISTATQTALDLKLDDSQLITGWGDQGALATDNNIPSAKLTKKYVDDETTARVNADTALQNSKIDTAGTGLSRTDTTLNHSNSVTAGHKGSANTVPVVYYDSEGHITSNTSEATIQITESQVTGLVSDLESKLDDSQLVTYAEGWSQNPSDAKIPSEKLVKESLGLKIDTAGTGLTLDGTTLNHTNSVTAEASGLGSASEVPIIKYDTEGHITTGTTKTSIQIAESQVTNLISDLGTKLDKVTHNSGLYAYTNDSAQQQTLVSREYVAGAIPRWTEGGNLNSADPTANGHVATKNYVDSHDNDKVDKRTTTGFFAYTHDGATQNETKISKEYSDYDAIVQRNSDGTISTYEPTQTYHAATKNYVDLGLQTKAPVSHASGETTYGIGSTASYGHVKVDNAMSADSTNPVQNKIILSYINSSIGTATANFLGTYPASKYQLYNDYTTFTTTSDYVDYYVYVNTTLTKVTASNKDTLNIDPGVTKAYELLAESLEFDQAVVDAWVDPPTAAIESAVSTAIATRLSTDGVTPTNNDYVFVAVNYSSTIGVDFYWRCKYDGTTWLYEYTLNNSTFTQAQWDSINSLVTNSSDLGVDVKDVNDHMGNAHIHVPDYNTADYVLTSTATGVPEWKPSVKYANGIGSATTDIGGPLRPVYVDDGAVTSLPKDLVTTGNTDQIIDGEKTFKKSGSNYTSVVIQTNRTSGWAGGIDYKNVSGTILTECRTSVEGEYNINLVNGTKNATITNQRAYLASNTTDIVTIGSLQESTDVVHRSGNETIDGIKTFNNTIVVGNTPQWAFKNTKSNLPSNRATFGSSFTEALPVGVQNSSGNSFAQIRFRDDVALRSMSLGLFSPTDNDWRTLGVVDNGTIGAVYGYAVSRDTPTEIDEILTLRSGVTLKTAQTISATKTHTSMNPTINKSLYLKNDTVANRYQYQDYVDSSGSRMGAIGSMSVTDGRYGTYLQSGNTPNLFVQTNGTDHWATAKYRSYATASNDDILTKAHLESAITINGAKTLVGSLDVKGTPHIVSALIPTADAPSSNIVGARLQFVPSDATIGDVSKYIGQLVPFHYINYTSLGTYVKRIDSGTNHYVMSELRVNSDGTGYLTAPSRTYNASNTSDVVTIGSLQGSTDVVHRSGNEPIDGIKTFSSSIYDTGTGYIYKNTAITYADVPSSNGGVDAFRLLDKNDIWYGIYGVERYTDGRVQAKLQVKGVTGNHCRIDVVKKSDDTEYATAPFRPYADGVTTSGSSDILTKAHLESAITINGAKTFTANVSTRASDRNATAHTGSGNGFGYDIYDSVGNKISAIYNEYTPTESRICLYAINKNDNNVQIHDSLRLIKKLDGTGYMSGPYRTYDANNTSDVVTIGSLQQSTDVVHRAGNETIDGFKKFSENIIGNSDIRLLDNSYALGTAPSSDSWSNGYRICDKDGQWISTFQIWLGSNGYNQAKILIRDSVSGTTGQFSVLSTYMTGPNRSYASAGSSDVLVKDHVADMMSANVGNGQISLTSSRGTAIDNFTVNQSSGKNIVLPASSTQYTNQSLTFALQSTPDFTDYPYMASKSITGLTSDMYASVTYDDSQVSSGQYAPFCQTLAGEVRLYAKSDVGTQTIPTISVGMDDSSAQQSMSNFVTLDGAQTIAGVKTFTSTPIVSHDDNNLNLQNPNFTIGTAPASTKWATLNYTDSTNTRHAMIAVGTSILGNSEMRFRVYDYNHAHNAVMGLFALANGNNYLTAPTRGYDASNTSDVVTIGSLQASTDVVHTSGNETISGFKSFKNSWDINTYPTAYRDYYYNRLIDANNNAIIMEGTREFTDAIDFGGRYFAPEYELRHFYRIQKRTNDHALIEVFEVIKKSDNTSVYNASNIISTW